MAIKVAINGFGRIGRNVARAILEGTPIPLFNRGHMRRDFTYIDDAVEAVIRLIDRVPALQATGAHAKERFRNEQIACRHYAHEHGLDRPDVLEWRWPY